MAKWVHDNLAQQEQEIQTSPTRVSLAAVKQVSQISIQKLVKLKNTSTSLRQQ